MAAKCFNCKSVIRFDHYVRHDETVVGQTWSCYEPIFCEPCAIHGAIRRNTAYRPKVEQVQDENPGIIPVMFTFTVPNRENIYENYELLTNGWKRQQEAARRGKSSSGRHALIEWNKVLGGISAMEATYGQGGWHIHRHVFALLRPGGYIDPNKHHEEWSRFVGVRAFTNVIKCRGGVYEGLKECLKYPTKFVNRDGEQSLTYEQRKALHSLVKGNVRMVNPFGILRGVKVDMNLDKDDASDLDGEVMQFYARWAYGLGRYEYEFPGEEKRLGYIKHTERKTA